MLQLLLLRYEILHAKFYIVAWSRTA